jgi:uncharacterized transporter YbjL
METLKIIISVLATLLASVVLIMLWFASRNKKLRDEQENKVYVASIKLEESNESLDKAVREIMVNTNANLKLCKLRHEMIDHTLENHSERLIEIGKEIHLIEIDLAKVNGK